MTTLTKTSIRRGEVWNIRFDPSEGDEIKKIRPAVVMTVPEAGKMKLHIVVPVTGWQPQFVDYFWIVPLSPTNENGLSKKSAADSFQVKSVSVNRFQSKLGRLPPNQLKEIAIAVALCVGHIT